MNLIAAARWRDAYLQVTSQLVTGAPTARPVLAASNACVDAVFQIDAERLSRVIAARGRAAGESDKEGSELLGRVVTRIARGQGGELLTRWPGGPTWIASLLGPPDRRQLGGTGLQASWALATVGAASVVALADRSPEQLAVIDPRTRLCAEGMVVPAGSVAPSGTPTKLPHCILEFAAGTRCGSLTVPRSDRIILRFGDNPLERDEQFFRMAPTLAEDAGAGLVSALNSLRDAAADDRDWVVTLAQMWSEASLEIIHHELAEFPTPNGMRQAVSRGFATSLGLSLSELFTLVGAQGDPRLLARDVATRYEVRRVIVHADDWTLAVHRGDPQHQERVLLAGNALAAARAREGQPTAFLDPAEEAIYTDDLPASGALGYGWRATSVPAPYLQRPVRAVGLGDTFTAGVLLAESLSRSTGGAPPQASRPC